MFGKCLLRKKCANRQLPELIPYGGQLSVARSNINWRANVFDDSRIRKTVSIEITVGA